MSCKYLYELEKVLLWKLSLEVVILEEHDNTLLNRREIKSLIKNSAGKVKRADAADIVAKQLNVNRNVIIPINMKCETGKSDIYATMYIYNNEDEAKKYLPRYRILRNMSNEDRKKLLDEEKANRLKAKQTRAAETKSGSRAGKK
jgi:small subunit ribosomal protein S24e